MNLKNGLWLISKVLRNLINRLLAGWNADGSIRMFLQDVRCKQWNNENLTKYSDWNYTHSDELRISFDETIADNRACAVLGMETMFTEVDHVSLVYYNCDILTAKVNKRTNNRSLRTKPKLQPNEFLS